MACHEKSISNSTNTAMSIQVTVISDIACPWCYVGMKRLDEAIQQFRCWRAEVTSGVQDFEIEIQWKPFQIDPSTRMEGEEFESYCRRRWGGSGWTNHLRSEGFDDGATFSNWKWWPNTLLAHQLVTFAEQKTGVTSSHDAVSAIFRALYEEGKNISLIPVLVQIGVSEWNLPKDQLLHYLQTNDGAQLVKNDIQSVKQRYHVTGVPVFVISGNPPSSGANDIRILRGAQKPRVLLETMKQIVTTMTT